MKFHDETDQKDKSFDIDLAITADSNGSLWITKYRFNPPQYAETFEVCRALNQGKTWSEKGNPELRFDLRNWEKFCAGKSDWFEIERLVEKGAEGSKVRFKRRYTVKPDRLISEKWLKSPGKNWTFSHKQDLARTK